MPGIPEHRFKAGLDYWVTPKWKVGGDMIVVSDQIFFGDDSNLNPSLGGYWRADLHTSYDVHPACPDLRPMCSTSITACSARSSISKRAIPAPRRIHA